MMTHFEVWTDDAGIRSLHVRIGPKHLNSYWDDWRFIKFL